MFVTGRGGGGHRSLSVLTHRWSGVAPGLFCMGDVFLLELYATALPGVTSRKPQSCKHEMEALGREAIIAKVADGNLHKMEDLLSGQRKR